MKLQYSGKKQDLEQAKNKPKSSKWRTIMNAVFAGTILLGSMAPYTLANTNMVMETEEERIEGEYLDPNNPAECIGDISVDIDISETSVMSEEEILATMKQKNIGNIIVKREIRPKACDNTYDPITFLKIKKQINEYIQGIDKNAPELEKFMEIYQRVGANIKFDEKAFDKDINFNYWYYNQRSSRNLYRPLLSKTALSEGYTNTLMQLLKEVGMYCREIEVKDKHPITTKEGKVVREVKTINLVKITDPNTGQYQCYYVDITRDAKNIQDNKPLQYCLKSEKEISKQYEILSKNLPKCPESMKTKKIETYCKPVKDIKKVNTIESKVEADKLTSFLEKIKVKVNPLATEQKSNTQGRSTREEYTRN